MEQPQSLPDNVGEVGLKSIRIGGMKIEDLGMVQQAHVRAQIPLMLDTERKNRIEELIAKFPHHRVDYLQSRIKEAHENIVRVGTMVQEQQTMIDEYRSIIVLCEFRDAEIIRIENDLSIELSERLAQTKLLKKKLPAYNVEAMEQQIVQSREGIERGESVIAQEYVDIEEHANLLGLCQVRDEEFKKLGVRQTAGNV